MRDLLYAFFVALGVVVGGSLVGTVPALFLHDYPVRTLVELAERLKLWALVAALGGTFATIRGLELGLLGGRLDALAQQLLFIISAFAGAHSGYLLIAGISGGK